MRKAGKKFTAARAAVPERPHTIEEAVPLMQKVKFAKFDETVELAMRLGVDPKHADQMVRGTVVLPHGLGKSKKVLAIAGGDKQREATEAGADHVGGEEQGRIFVHTDSLVASILQPAAGGVTIEGIIQPQQARMLLDIEVRGNDVLMTVRPGSDVAVGLDDIQDALEGVIGGAPTSAAGKKTP